MTLHLDHVGESIFLVDEDNTLFRTWRADDFTQRKFANAIKKIRENAPNGLEIVVEGKTA